MIRNCCHPFWLPARLWCATLVVSLGLFAVAVAIPAPAATAQDLRGAPEVATGSAAKNIAVARRHMVAAANPYATEAGRQILRAGGSAIDAAITVQLVLNLVEPQSSGIGGGAFILHFDAAKAELKSYDGRETAPAGALPGRFLRGGKPMPFLEAVRSGLSTGVPGVVRLMEQVHKQHGTLPWAQLFEPAIKLAEEGFEVSSRLHLLLRWNGIESFSPAAQRYFFSENGSAWPIGQHLKNPQFAATLRRIAEHGADGFYTGPVADSIVAAVNAAPHAVSGMTLADLAAYRAVERPPLCISYRGDKICGMGPPSSGGIAVAQTLKLLAGLDGVSGPQAAMSTRAMHLIAEAEKLAYADRDRYVADPDFIAIPDELLGDTYLDSRRALIDPARAMPPPQAGEPQGLKKGAFGTDGTIERAGTSHISIIDGNGNAVAMTTTIEGAFGSGLWASGFLLNNELTDFSFQPTDRDGRPVANAVAGGKRPRSSMAPTIVFDGNGQVKAVLGSPGGNRIILYVVKTLVALLDWGYDAQAAASLINFGSRGGPFEIEFDLPALWIGLRMKQFGHGIAPDLLTSGTHIITVRSGRLEGGADPRREGVALGD